MRAPPTAVGDEEAAAFLSAIVDSTEDAVIGTDSAGTILVWNAGAEATFGYGQAEAVGQSVAMLVPVERRDAQTRVLQEISQGVRISHFETTGLHRDGRLIHLAMTISPVHQRDRTVSGASLICRDISAAKEAEQNALLLAAIVNSSEDAIASKDLNGVLTSWNASAERIFGYTAEEAIGRSVVMLVPADRKGEEPAILQRLRRGERVEHFETVRVRKDGTHFPVSLTISPIKDRSGTVIGASKIARDITELHRISAEREKLLVSEREARGQAERASRMKDDFLATVSHELRTPLNAMMGWAQILLESRGDPGVSGEAAQVILRNAQFQAQLIDDLLDMSRIVAGKMTLEVETVDLHSVVRNALSAVQHAADFKGITLQTLLASAPVPIMGDRKRLQQIVWNLVSNAVKFTPKQGKVRIAAARVNSHIELSVSDNGPGIDPLFLPHVFERFRQADSSLNRQHGGLGIGLALVKELVEMHGGTVRAFNLPTGGAHFEVHVPFAATREPLECPVGAADSDHFTDLAGIRVLAVDDDLDSLQMVRHILKNRNAVVEVAGSSAEALAAFPHFRPHVILSDIGMPGQTGYEFIAQIRTLPGGARVPAAALTALARSEDRMAALRAGFQTHIAKPIDALELAAVVASLAKVGAEEV